MFGRGKAPISKDTLKVPNVQAINDHAREVGKKGNQIWFGVEGVKELYDEWLLFGSFMLPMLLGTMNKNIKYKMPIAAQPCLEILLVRRVEVPYTASEINEIYFACDLDFTVQCKRLIYGGCQSYPWLARMISKGLPPWANGVGQIKRRNLSVQAKYWLGFVGNHLLPSRNDQDITFDKSIVVGCIMDKISINPRELIAEMIQFRSKKLAKLEHRVTTLEAGGDCEGVASVWKDLNSLRAEIHSGQPFFGLDETEITFPSETSGPVLLFDDFFGEGHKDINDEVEVDLIEGLLRLDRFGGSKVSSEPRMLFQNSCAKLEQPLLHLLEQVSHRLMACGMQMGLSFRPRKSTYTAMTSVGLVQAVQAQLSCKWDAAAVVLKLGIYPNLRWNYSSSPGTGPSHLGRT
ncbi:hypothetical protein BC332_03448 [Capsicum chinense]|nr:hypothetical protein BC332_03448 [Capsicum chinense]